MEMRLAANMWTVRVDSMRLMGWKVDADCSFGGIGGVFIPYFPSARLTCPSAISHGMEADSSQPGSSFLALCSRSSSLIDDCRTKTNMQRIYLRSTDITKLLLRSACQIQRQPDPRYLPSPSITQLLGQLGDIVRKFTLLFHSAHPLKIVLIASSSIASN